jgi:hypothetical protein
MSAIALVGTVAPSAIPVTVATYASGDVSLVAGGEVLLVPTTRAVVVTRALPTASAGISAVWTTTFASRVSGAAYEYAEISCYVDLANGVLAIVSEAIRVTGATGDAASLGQVTAAQFGTIIGASITCPETPQGGHSDLILFSSPTVLVTGDAFGTSTALHAPTGGWSVGHVKYLAVLPAANEYLHFTTAGSKVGDYTHGKFIIKFHCRFTL